MKRKILAIVWTLISVLFIAMGVGNTITSALRSGDDLMGFIFLIVIGVILGIAEIFVLGVFWNKIEEADKERRRKQKDSNVPERAIKRVDILGTRVGEETRILATYNFTIYSLMITYEDGGREVVECQKDSAVFNKLLPYFVVDNKGDSFNSK